MAVVLGYYLERHYGWEKEVAAAATREDEARHWPLRWMIEIVISYPLHHQLEGAVDVAKTRRISPRRDSWLTWVVWYCWEANHRSVNDKFTVEYAAKNDDVVLPAFRWDLVGPDYVRWEDP